MYNRQLHSGCAGASARCCKSRCVDRARATQETDGTQAVGVALGVTSDYLLDGATDEAAKARFTDRELLQQFQEVEQLPDEDKNVVKKLLDAFLTKKHLQALAR